MTQPTDESDLGAEAALGCNVVVDEEASAKREHVYSAERAWGYLARCVERERR